MRIADIYLFLVTFTEIFKDCRSPQKTVINRLKQNLLIVIISVGFDKITVYIIDIIG
jgi:hypothetical protein